MLKVRYDLHSTNRVSFNYISKCKILLKIVQKRLLKFVKMTSSVQWKWYTSESKDFTYHLKSLFNKTVIDFNFGRHKD